MATHRRSTSSPCGVSLNAVLEFAGCPRSGLRVSSSTRVSRLRRRLGRRCSRRRRRRGWGYVRVWPVERLADAERAVAAIAVLVAPTLDALEVDAVLRVAAAVVVLLARRKPRLRAPL